MMKIPVACLLLMIATLVSGFQTTSEWVKHTSVEGRYSVLFPQQPKLMTQQVLSETGGETTQYQAQVVDSESLLGITYYDLLPGTASTLDKLRDEAVARVKGTLLSSEAISLGGYPGLESKASAKIGDKEILILARFYNVGGRIYIVKHLILKSSDTPARVEKTTKFFDSFKVATSK